MTTTREKFRARRARRRLMKFYGGTQWTAAEIYRMKKLRESPMPILRIYSGSRPASPNDTPSGPLILERQVTPEFLFKIDRKPA